MPDHRADDVLVAPELDQLVAFVRDQRLEIRGLLDGMSEEQARRRLVPSLTTLLGLVKHATFVEQVMFQEAVAGGSRAELGIAAGPDESFTLLLHVVRELARHAGHGDILREQVLAANSQP